MRNEFRLAARMLIRRPILSCAIALTVGFAIAAVTVAFAVVNGILLEPLPSTEPDRLVTIWERRLPGPQHQEALRNLVSPANYFIWKEELKSFDRVAAMFEVSAAVTGDGDPEQVGAMVSSASYFAMVGARPLAGRFYTAEEDVEGGPRVVVISEGYWRRRFGG